MEYQQLYQQLIGRILDSKGKSALPERRAAFNNSCSTQPLNTLIHKVANHAYQVTDSDIAAVKASGITEDELFELIICGAVGQASRQYQNGLAALTEATKEGGPYAS